VTTYGSFAPRQPQEAQHAFTGPTPQLEEWTPAYLRAWISPKASPFRCCSPVRK